MAGAASVGELHVLSTEFPAHSEAFYSNTTLENVKLVYRMPFERSNVKGNDSKIGNESAVHLIQMIALQLDCEFRNHCARGH